MPIRRHLIRCHLVLCCTLSLLVPQLSIAEIHTVYDPAGRAVFHVQFFGAEHPPIMQGESQADWSLTDRQKAKILQAISTWAEIIQPAPGTAPAVIHVGTIGSQDNPGARDVNAFGASSLVIGDPQGNTQLAAAMQGMDPGDLSATNGSHAQFVMGVIKFDDMDIMPSHIPLERRGPTDLTAVAFHELAHSLGILGYFMSNPSPGHPQAWHQLTNWGQHLRDDHGRPLQPLQRVRCPAHTPCNVGQDLSNAFDVSLDQGHFAGSHVSEVLQGAMPGVPVSVLTEDKKHLDSDYFSHIELKNSLMSHQEYRNYTVFMEAELAVLQDLGYTIDRRNFFGYSVYGSGQTIENHNGFFLRQDGRYMTGRYNTATLGLGLHIYGSHNTLTQVADLLSVGAGGAGMRVDGEANTLFIAPATRVHANGLNGRGVMFTYGRNHQLVQRGDIEALGKGGIGVSFDFGGNAMGTSTFPGSYRGSYIYRVYNPYADPDAPPPALLEELTGALVTRFDLSGRVAGHDAAIFMSDNALVERTSVMRGARIEGDIVSLYAEADEGGALRLSRLDFGRLADAKGRSTDSADEGFAFRYDGLIHGRNLDLTAYGGHTSLNGTHSVHGVTVNPGATLSGNARYQGLDADWKAAPLAGGFTNLGTLAPGNSIGAIFIDGDYTQGPDGTLHMEFDGRGGQDTLRVTGAANLDGTLRFTALSDWYPSDWSHDTAGALDIGGPVVGTFSSLQMDSVSPTLDFSVLATGPASFRLLASRAPDAYRRHARGPNAASTGTALDQLVGLNAPDLRTLYRGLDFSGGSAAVDQGLRVLSAEAYSALYGLGIERERQVTDVLRARNLAPRPSVSTWAGFAAGFGGMGRQDGDMRRVGYHSNGQGAILGGERGGLGDGYWTAGIHATMGQHTLRTEDPHQATGSLNAFGIGVHARRIVDDGLGWHAQGLVRLGVEHGTMERRLRIGDYQADNKTDWTAPYASAMLETGYAWPLAPSLSAGPIVALEYTAQRRPEMQESGPNGSRLTLEASSHHALYASLGLGTQWLRQDGDSRWRVGASLMWEHDVLDREAVQAAHFTNHPQAGFESRNTVGVRDTAVLRAGLGYTQGDRISVNLGLAARMAGSQRTLSGTLQMNWKF